MQHVPAPGSMRSSTRPSWIRRNAVPAATAGGSLVVACPQGQGDWRVPGRRNPTRNPRPRSSRSREGVRISTATLLAAMRNDTPPAPRALRSGPPKLARILKPPACRRTRPSAAPSAVRPRRTVAASRRGAQHAHRPQTPV